MEKIKIALALGSFSGGGAERVMVIIANKFVEWGYQVDLVIALDDGPYKELLDHRVNKVVLVKKEKNKIVKRIAGIYRATKYLKNSDVSVILSTIREFNIFIYFNYFISRNKAKILLREADTFDDIFKTSKLRSKILLFLMKVIYKKTDCIIANSNITKEDIIKYLSISENDIKVIYNPLDLKQINKTAELKGADYIVACGRLVDKKNFGDLIKAFPFVLKKYPNMKLKILGDGVEKEKLQSLIKDLELQHKVEMIGFVDNPYAYYKGARVFVQTSLWEGFGYVLTEAIACGTPVVAYDSKGAMREILADGKYGELTPVGDLNKLSAAIIKQIENPTSIELLNEAVVKYDINKIAKEYLNLLVDTSK